jgi:hypothetical protein
MRNGQCITLKAREGNHDYNYTTADETYWAGDRIARWMQIPDTEFVPFCPAPAPPEERREARVVDAEHPPEGYRLAAEGEICDPAKWLTWQESLEEWIPAVEVIVEPYCPNYERKNGIKLAWKHLPMALPVEPADLPATDWQREAIARGEMAERLRVAEARVAVLERAASWALGEGDSDFPGPYAGYGAIGWRVKFRALLEGAQP